MHYKAYLCSTKCLLYSRLVPKCKVTLADIKKKKNFKGKKFRISYIIKLEILASYASLSLSLWFFISYALFLFDEKYLLPSLKVRTGCVLNFFNWPACLNFPKFARGIKDSPGVLILTCNSSSSSCEQGNFVVA